MRMTLATESSRNDASLIAGGRCVADGCARCRAAERRPSRRRRSTQPAAPAAAAAPPPPRGQPAGRRRSAPGCRRSAADELGVDGRPRRAEPRLAAQARVLPARQRRTRRGGAQVVAANADMLKQNPHWVITIEGPLRRARHGGVQPGARRTAGDGGQDLPDVARHLAPIGMRTVSYGKEFPFDRGHDRRRVVEEPPRALRDHGEVECEADAMMSAAAKPPRRTGLAAAVTFGASAVGRAGWPGRGAEPRAPADGGGPAHAAGTDSSSSALTLAQVDRDAEGVNPDTHRRRRARPRARASPTRSC